MQISVLVRVLEARETQQRVRIAIDRLDHVVDERDTLTRLNGIAEPHFGEHAAHGLCRAGAQTSGSSHAPHVRDRKSTRLNSSHLVISYAVFCLKKKRRK